MSTPRLSPKQIAGVLGIVVLWTAFSLGGLLVRAEWFAYHLLFEWRGAQPVPAELVLVALDEPTLEDLAVWPLPRTVYAQLIDGLVGAGATAVGMDITFPQSQNTITDAALAAALGRHPGRIVLAANFQPGEDGNAQRQQLVLPLTALRERAAVGIVDLAFDADGGIHRFETMHLGVDPDDLSALKPYPSFDWEIATRHARATGRPSPDASYARAGESWLTNYVGPPGRVPHVSMISVLEAIARHDAAFMSRFKDKAVLVGATSLRLQDQYPTPLSARAQGGGSASYMPGVEIHANIVHTLLHDNPIRRAPAWAMAGFLLLLGAIGGTAFSRLSPGPGLAAAAALAAFSVLLSHLLFSQGSLWLDPAAPLLAIATLYVAGVVSNFLRAETHRRFYRRTFERYVAKDIVDEILRNPGMAPKLGGERREVTVLFSDIRSFTTISEQRTPEEVVEFLNAYLTAMAEVIHQNKGSIDKYIGDAILAIWGNVKRLPQEEAAALAVRTGLEMLRRVEALRPEWQAAGYPRIDIGIGINTGDAVVGNIGSPDKLEFGVIGDSINVASRLEGLTKEYGGALLISGRTRELLGERFDCTFLDAVKVKGRAATVDIYRVERELRP